MSVKIIQGDALTVLKTLPSESVHCVVTSPPYWGLRDYGVEGQLGLEKTPEEYVAKMVEVFREVRRVLREDGVCFVNMGDTYWADQANESRDPEEASDCVKGYDGNFQRKLKRNTGIAHRREASGLKPKDLCGIPWRLAFALQADGWWLRQDIIWAKPNPMPESVTDRCTKAHEYLFLLAKAERYFFDVEAIKEPATPQERTGIQMGYATPKHAMLSGQSGVGGPRSTLNGPNGNTRNRRSVWTINSEPYPESHFATFPTALVKPCILAGTSARGVCPKCGGPWERVVEADGRVQSGGTTERIKGRGIGHGNGYNSMLIDGAVTIYKTTGWRPTCECGIIETVPATVLDLFGGSGTVGQVALELGRKAILIELNPAYVELARKRTNVTPGLQLA